MADIRYYDVILKPIVTEKSMNAMGEKKYTFLVHPEANKAQIKECTYHEHGRKEKTPRYGCWKNSQNQKGNCCADREQQGHRDLPGTVIPDLIPAAKSKRRNRHM